MQNKPTLYIPDFEAYGDPFMDLYKIVYDPHKKYNVDLMKKCDFLLLTGGADINPSYYGQERSDRIHPSYYDAKRDEKEFDLANEAILSDIPIIGVCRGAQWLAILAGGSLIQHVDGHETGMHFLELYDPDDPEFNRVSMSTSHHQMCNLTGVDHMLYAWTNHLSSLYLGQKGVKLFPKGLTKEPEIFYIPNIRGFGIQGHPEYLSRHAPGNRYIRKLLTKTYLIQE